MVFPLRSPLIKSKLCSFFISATWIVAAAIFLLYLFTNELVEYSGKMWCGIGWNEVFEESSSFAYYALADPILVTYIPLVLLVFLYSIILIKVKIQAHPGEQSANTHQQRNRRNRNVFQMSTAIVLAFLICWLPFKTS